MQLVAVISAPLGLVIGAISGYFGGAVDRIMMGITDIFLSMPRLILPSLQVNMRAGHLPPADDDGRIFLKVPIDAL